MAAIASDEPEVSPSTLYATACVLEGAPFINGSPQNTFVPGLIELAVEHNVLIGGDDFKSGQVSTTRHDAAQPSTGVMTSLAIVLWMDYLYMTAVQQCWCG